MKRLFAILGLSIALFAMSANTESSAQDRSYIKNAISNWGECRNVTITETNGNVAIYGANGNARQGIPSQMSDALQSLNDDGKTITDLHLTENGAWVIIYNGNGIWRAGITDDFEETLLECNDDGETITSVSFNDNGEWVIVSEEYIHSSSSEITNWLSEGSDEYGILISVCMTNNSMVAVYEEGYKFLGDVPESLKKELYKTTIDVTRVKFAGQSWFISDEEGTYSYRM